MGLDYSIKTFIKKEKLSNCLNWLYENSYEYDSTPLKVKFNNEELKINGGSFKLNDYKNPYIGKTEVVEDFDILYYSTSLIFDIDPKIIASVADWTLDYNSHLLGDFIESFEQLYLGNGKIRIGGYDTKITRLKNHDAFELEFTAVTTDMSIMMEKSVSVKKWILEFSRQSESIISYLDLEHNGKRVLYYMGREVDITITKGFEEDSYDMVSGFVKDYFGLNYDKVLK